MICKSLAAGIIEVVGAGLADSGFGGSDFLSGDALTLFVLFPSVTFFAISSTFLFNSESVKIFLPNASAISSAVKAIPAIFPIAPIAPGALEARLRAANIPSVYSLFLKFINPLKKVTNLPIPPNFPPPPGFGPLVPGLGGGGVLPGKAFPSPRMTA